MNKRIVLSAVSIFASLSLVAGATFAFFSDEGTSSDNVFGAGTFDLLLDGLDTADVLFSFPDMGPGDMMAQDIVLSNGGTVDIAKVGFNADLSSGDSAFADALLLQVFEGTTSDNLTCTGTELTGEIETQLGVGELTVNNFTSFFDSLFDGEGSRTAFNNATDNNLCLKVTFDEEAGSELEGLSANVAFTFQALQDDSQIPGP